MSGVPVTVFEPFKAVGWPAGPRPTGFIAREALTGELAALVGDLVQQLHYALGAYDTLPQPSPRTSSFTLLLPTEAAAEACQAQLAALGSSDVATHDAGADGWAILATFPDLPPDPSYDAREAQLMAIAERHGGRYAGSHR